MWGLLSIYLLSFSEEAAHGGQRLVPRSTSTVMICHCSQTSPSLHWLPEPLEFNFPASHLARHGWLVRYVGTDVRYTGPVVSSGSTASLTDGSLLCCDVCITVTTSVVKTESWTNVVVWNNKDKFDFICFHRKNVPQFFSTSNGDIGEAGICDAGDFCGKKNPKRWLDDTCLQTYFLCQATWVCLFGLYSWKGWWVNSGLNASEMFV